MALPSGKFLRVRKVFARIIEKDLLNCLNTFKTIQISPDECQFSRLFQNGPDFPSWLPIFRIISKLSGFFQMIANFTDDFKTVRIFPDDCQFSGWFQNCPDFPDDYQFSEWFPNFIDEMRMRTVVMSSFTPTLGQRSIWTIQPSCFQFYSWSGRSG